MLSKSKDDAPGPQVKPERDPRESRDTRGGDKSGSLATAPSSTSSLHRRREQVETYLELTRIQQHIDRRSRGLFAAHGLDDVTPAQANVLLVLMQERRPLTARRLAELLALSEVTVGRFVATLERRGWIARRPDPRDRRARLLHPTDKTRAAMPTFISIANALLDESFAGLDPDALRALAETLAKVRRNVGS